MARRPRSMKPYARSGVPARAGCRHNTTPSGEERAADSACACASAQLSSTRCSREHQEMTAPEAADDEDKDDDGNGFVVLGECA
jgi:hypothetical protein